MSNELVSLKRALPALPTMDRRIRGQAASNLRRIVEIAEASKAAMNEIGEISTFAEFEAVRCLLNSNLWEEIEQLPLEEKRRFADLRETTCEELGFVSIIASAKIISLIDGLPPEVQPKLWDQLTAILANKEDGHGD